MRDRSNDPSHYEQMLYHGSNSWSFIVMWCQTYGEKPHVGVYQRGLIQQPTAPCLDTTELRPIYMNSVSQIPLLHL